MKTNITYIISNINKALAFEWISLYLNKNDFNLNFILLNSSDSELETFLTQNNIQVYRIKYRGKIDLLSSIYSVSKILKKNKSEIVHTHLFEANIIGLTAAWIVGIKKRIHTRHHSNYHHIYHPKAVKYDKYINRISTDIVAISEVVKNILVINENTPAKKVNIIHHGFKLDEFTNVSELFVNRLRQKYVSPDCHPIIGVISRYTEWKGIQYIIPAFKKLLLNYPNALLLLANANGDYKTEITKLLETIPKRNYLEIPFESDIFSLYKLFDIFIHVPITSEIEAFGQIYVESLASGIPSIFTLSGISKEFIIDHQNALVVPYKNSHEIYNAILELLENEELVKNITTIGKSDVNKMFGIKKMILSLEKLYGK